MIRGPLIKDSEVREHHEKTWGSGVLGRGNSTWVLEEEQAGAWKASMGRCGVRKGKGRRARSLEASLATVKGLVFILGMEDMEQGVSTIWLTFKKHHSAVWKIVQRLRADPYNNPDLRKGTFVIILSIYLFSRNVSRNISFVKSGILSVCSLQFLIPSIVPSLQ